MTKIIFLHGFFASGSCILAQTLKKTLEPEIKVLTPDLPLHPLEALAKIQEMCQEEHPDLLVGNSCGSFYAQIISSRMGIPALLGNPHLEMTKFLQERIGTHTYKSPRFNGKQQFVIDEALIDEFAEVQKSQFDDYQPVGRDKIYGLFGENDGLAHYEPVFLKYYTRSFHFPGAHTPTAEEVEQYYVPLVKQILEDKSSCS